MSQFTIMLKSMKCVTWVLYKSGYYGSFWPKTEPMTLFVQNFRTFVQSQHFRILMLCKVLEKKNIKVFIT